nr:fumarylacetoacetate hydrolase family protein [Rhodococcus sp. WY5]
MAFSRSASNEAGDDQRRDDAKNAAVARLQQVEATGIPCASLRDLIGSEDIPLAYLVQEQIVSARVTDNNERVERKIGLTSPAVQAQLKVDQPDFGTLLHDMLVTQAEPVAHDRLLQPRIEAEIAFVLGADIDDLAPSLGTIAASIQFARPAFEIVDSRIAGWDITIADTVADNASSGLFVLGNAEVSLSDFDPVAVEMTMTQDGETVSSGNGTDCLGNPLIALQWLAHEWRRASATRCVQARSSSAAPSARWSLHGSARPITRHSPASVKSAHSSAPPAHQEHQHEFFEGGRHRIGKYGHLHC